MADAEGRLISRVVLERSWREVMDARITEDWFEDEEHRDVFGFISRHYASHSEVPSRHLLAAQSPNYRLFKVEDSLGPLIEQMRAKRQYALAVEALQDAGETLSESRDAMGALERLVQAYQQMQTESSALVDFDLTKTVEQRLDRYEERANRGTSLLGIPTGFKTVDDATSGWQPKQLVTVIATPKVGKSTLMLKMALNAWEQGYSVLFISFEMTSEEQAMRADAMLAHISHTDYSRGTLDKNQLGALEQALYATESRKPFILSADYSSVTTVSGIAAKIEQHGVDICFVDGLYLLRDELGEAEGSPQALTNITRNLKRLCQRADIPIVCSTQALSSKVSKRQGVTADSIGWSSSFAADSDVILGLQAVEGDEDMRELRVVLSRNCGRKQVQVHWDWTSSTFEEPEPMDVYGDLDVEDAT